MQESDIRWNEPARAKILEDSDRVLREAVLDLGNSMNGESSDAVYAELFKRLEGRFIDFEPGPDIRKYADAIANGELGPAATG